jgi:putative flavoprotein involved in K+ transport
MSEGTSTHTNASARTERYDVIVIGGGQAGLAMGQRLAAHHLDFVILDDRPAVGDQWRTRWDSLRLFTPAKYSSLPGMVFPSPPSHLPDKDEVADYLVRYAERFALPVRLNTRVRALTRRNDLFVLTTDTVTYEAAQVVVATGPFQQPFIPSLAAALDPAIHQRHSSTYRNPFDLPEGPVLVVGAGPSGAQIALELARFRKVWLAGPDTGHLPRRLLGRDLFDWLWPAFRGATLNTRRGRALRQRASGGGDTLIGLPEHTLRDAGVTRLPRLDAHRGGWPMCGDTLVQPRVMLWCTGFRPAFEWIELPVFDEAGRPRHARGIARDCPGLYFLGQRFQHRITSSLIGGVGDDAAFLAERIAHCDACTAADE